MFVSSVNSQIASVHMGLNHLCTYARLVCSEIIYISFEKVHIIFLHDFQRFMYWKPGKITKENIKVTDK